MKAKVKFPDEVVNLFKLDTNINNIDINGFLINGIQVELNNKIIEVREAHDMVKNFGFKYRSAEGWWKSEWLEIIKEEKEIQWLMFKPNNSNFPPKIKYKVAWTEAMKKGLEDSGWKEVYIIETDLSEGK